MIILKGKPQPIFFYSFELQRRIGIGSSLLRKIRNSGGNPGTWSGPIHKQSIRIPVGSEGLLLEVQSKVKFRSFVRLSTLRQDKYIDSGCLETGSMMDKEELIRFYEYELPFLLDKVKKLDEKGQKIRAELSEMLSERAQFAINLMTDTGVQKALDGLGIIKWMIEADFGRLIDGSSNF